MYPMSLGKRIGYLENRWKSRIEFAIFTCPAEFKLFMRILVSSTFLFPSLVLWHYGPIPKFIRILALTNHLNPFESFKVLRTCSALESTTPNWTSTANWTSTFQHWLILPSSVSFFMKVHNTLVLYYYSFSYSVYLSACWSRFIEAWLLLIPNGNVSFFFFTWVRWCASF
jgi:hypothetical protein